MDWHGEEADLREWWEKVSQELQTALDWTLEQIPEKESVVICKNLTYKWTIGRSYFEEPSVWSLGHRVCHVVQTEGADGKADES